MSNFACEYCGFELTGRRRHSARFCSSQCRQAAYRRRQAGLPEDLPPRELGGRGMIREPFREELRKRK